MKIKSVQAYPLAYPEPHYKGIERYITLARVESEDGQVGWGECISQFRESALATKIIVEQGLPPCSQANPPWTLKTPGTKCWTASGGTAPKVSPPSR